ncbi:MAG: DNA-binding protein [Chromatiales bacterium]|nr:DNA-binding protein [Chromatiales bacterium]
MKTVVIEVKSADESFADMQQALKSDKPDGCAHISFVSFELLWRVLTPNRWQLLQALTGAGPIGVRELAWRVGRDVRAVHADAQALASCGLVDKFADGKLHFPYDAVHVDFMLTAAYAPLCPSVRLMITRCPQAFGAPSRMHPGMVRPGRRGSAPAFSGSSGS